MKLGGVEAARGIAALLVVLPHATDILANPATPGVLPFGGLFMSGRAGVEFFFVLSGFIMMYVHHEDLGAPPAFAGFWRKRLLRIYPTYWAATAVLGAILVFSPTRDRAEQSVVHVFLSVFLLPETHPPILDVGWSLRHEMLFYVLFSVLILHRRIGAALLTLWCAGIVAGLVVTMVSGTALFGGQAGMLVFRGFNIEFFFGMAVGLLVRRPPRYPMAILGLGALLFLANALVESLGPPAAEWPPRTLCYALASAMILYGVAHLDRAKAWTISRPLLTFGRASYSIYLMHVTILLIVGQVFRIAGRYVPIPAEIAFLIGVPIAVAGGIVFSWLIEQPIMRLGRPALRPALAPRAPGLLIQPVSPSHDR